MSQENEPSPRFDTGAGVWTGRELIIWGGLPQRHGTLEDRSSVQGGWDQTLRDGSGRSSAKTRTRSRLRAARPHQQPQPERRADDQRDRQHEQHGAAQIAEAI